MWGAVGAAYSADVAQENFTNAERIYQLAADLSRFESRRFHTACQALKSTKENK